MTDHVLQPTDSNWLDRNSVLLYGYVCKEPYILDIEPDLYRYILVNNITLEQWTLCCHYSTFSVYTQCRRSGWTHDNRLPRSNTFTPNGHWFEKRTWGMVEEASTSCGAESAFLFHMHFLKTASSIWGRCLGNSTLGCTCSGFVGGLAPIARARGHTSCRCAAGGLLGGIQDRINQSIESRSLTLSWYTVPHPRLHPDTIRQAIHMPRPELTPPKTLGSLVTWVHHTWAPGPQIELAMRSFWPLKLSIYPLNSVIQPLRTAITSSSGNDMVPRALFILLVLESGVVLGSCKNPWPMAMQ